MAASNEQVQNWSDARVRVRAEAIRALYLALIDDRSAAFDDIYNNLNNSPTWADDRTDGPPHLLTPADLLSMNAFEEDIRALMAGHAGLATMYKACVRPVGA